MNSLKLTWLVGFIGVSKNWISPQDFMGKIEEAEIIKLDDETLSKIYIDLEDSKESFLKRINSIFSFSDESINKGIMLWTVYFLNEIRNSNEPVSKKLQNVSNVWAMVDYPESWRHFIHYLPIKDGVKTGETAVYGRFLDFLDIENRKLNDK